MRVGVNAVAGLHHGKVRFDNSSYTNVLGQSVIGVELNRHRESWKRQVSLPAAVWSLWH